MLASSTGFDVLNMNLTGYSNNLYKVIPTSLASARQSTGVQIHVVESDTKRVKGPTFIVYLVH